MSRWVRGGRPLGWRRGGQPVRVWRVLPAAAGQRLAVQVGGLQGSGDGASSTDIRLDGEAVFDVPPLPAEAPK